MLRLIVPILLIATPALTAPQLTACTAPEHRQFDFWVGRWQVTHTGQNEVVAESLIERVYGGCGIRENWMPRSGKDGGSLNIYMPAEHAWRQTWIDSNGSRVDFSGAWNGRAMVLAGVWPDAAGRRRSVRMTYTVAPDGDVRQFGEASYDDGANWEPDFDFTYQRAP